MPTLILIIIAIAIAVAVVVAMTMAMAVAIAVAMAIRLAGGDFLVEVPPPAWFFPDYFSSLVSFHFYRNLLAFSS